MKVLAINGSVRKGGNTAILIRAVFAELEKEGIVCEMVELGHSKLVGCQACGKCFKNLDKHCVVKSDTMNEIIDKMIAADGIILGSPTYFASCSAQMKCVIERAGMVARANQNMFRRKVGAPVVAVRRAGSTNCLDTINKFFFISEMIVPGSSYWNLGTGMDKGDVQKDGEGLSTMKDLGNNMAWLLKCINDKKVRKEASDAAE